MEANIFSVITIVLTDARLEPFANDTRQCLLQKWNDQDALTDRLLHNQDWAHGLSQADLKSFNGAGGPASRATRQLGVNSRKRRHVASFQMLPSKRERTAHDG